MIRSEITFFNMNGEILFEPDSFLNEIGFSETLRTIYIKQLREFKIAVSGNLTNFKRQFSFRLDNIKFYSCSLNYNFKNVSYICIQTETFFINSHLKKRVFQNWNNKLPAGWILEISNYKGFYRIYSGDLKFLKRNLYQDFSIQPLDLPNCVAFKNDDDWHNFRWLEPEIDILTNDLM